MEKANVIYINDGYSTVGTLKDIEQSLKDELIEYLENREDILGEDTQMSWYALQEIERMDEDEGLYILTFDPNSHFNFTVNKLIENKDCND